MIARVWRGATLAEDADAYAAYLEATGMRNAREIPGSRGTLVLRRVRGASAEFQTIMLFEQLADVRGFAGDELEAAVFFDLDEKYLVERELEVRHYEVDVHLEALSSAP